MENSINNEILTKLDSFQQENRMEFKNIHEQLHGVHGELKSFQRETREEFKVVTDLLHGISKTTQRTEEAVERLTPTAKDHEERINFLERSTARLRLLVDR